MALGYTLIALGLIGLIYGIVKKNRKSVVASILLLVFVAIVYAVYSYLYSLNPY